MGLHQAEPRSNAPRAARIPDDFIQQVNERADIVAIISRTVALKKSGANHVGLCPFHKEKSPSFTVNATKGLYHCFGCGASGTALNFLMEHDGTPFRDAVIELAQGAGMSLPVEMTQSGASGAPSVETGPLYAAMGLAAKYFAHVLRHSTEAKDYLKKRGVTGVGAKRFVIGMAPDEWRGLKEPFPDYEKNQAILLAGLIREKDGKDETSKNRYDTFRNRITFGVRDTRGRIIAFGGRVMANEEPKYLNSPESPIFNKSGALFGLYEAREAIRVKKFAVVVEGYMDVVMSSQHGVENAVASMGTAFTRSHAERLLTQTDMLVFAFDGDSAGRKAAWKAMETCIPIIEDHHVLRFVLFPDKQDPDEFMRTQGAAAFDDLVRKSPGLSEFLLSTLTEQNNNLASTEDRARFAAEASEVAKRLGFRTKLRALLLEQIATESRLPGVAIKAIQTASKARTTNATIWGRLAQAAVIVPATTLAARDLIIELLDPDDAHEMALIRTLQAISPESVDVQPVATAGANSAWLLARDTMHNAVDLIAEFREKQARDDLKKRFGAGEITEAEFIKQSLSMA